MKEKKTKMTKPILLWKSMKAGLKSNFGNINWKLNKWEKEDDIEICKRGFHASERITEAMQYVNMEILARVEVKGEHFSLEGKGKQCWSEMRITKAYVWTKEESVRLAIFAAESCIDKFEKEYPEDKRPRQSIEAAKKWLEEPTEENKRAAAAAADAVCAAAAAAAAADADAVCAAAHAADAVACAAAYAATLDKCEEYILSRIKYLKKWER